MALFIEIKVIALSGKSQCIVCKSGTLKCFVKSAPEKGKANKELIDIIAKKIRVAKGLIQIVSGGSSRKKLLKVQTAITYEQFLTLLGAGLQKKIIE